jgi:hypothetical protein
MEVNHGMSGLRGLTLAVRFLCELAMRAVLGRGRLGGELGA